MFTNPMIPTPADGHASTCPPAISDLLVQCGLDPAIVEDDWMDVLLLAGLLNTDSTLTWLYHAKEPHGITHSLEKANEIT
jgi:hypothetical protein